MSIQYSVDVNEARLNAIDSTIGASPVLELWNGTEPANPSASDTGTKIATGTLPSTWLAAATNPSGSVVTKVKAGTWTVTGLTAASTGTAADYFRITVSGVCKMQGTVTVTGGGGDATMDNISVADAQVATVSAVTITAANT